MKLSCLLLVTALAAAALAAPVPTSRPRNGNAYPLQAPPGPDATSPPRYFNGADSISAPGNNTASRPSRPIPFVARTTGTPDYQSSRPELTPISINGAVGVDGKPITVRSPRNTTAVDSDGQGQPTRRRNGGDPAAASICGANSLAASSYVQTCSLVMGFPNGGVGTCTGFIIGERLLGTAGHCVFDQDVGFVDWVEIYCNDAIGCAGDRTTLSATVAVTSQWFDTSVSGFTNPWDGAVIVTQDDLPYEPLGYGEYIVDQEIDVLVMGYPGNEEDVPGSPCQGYPDYTGCNQFSTQGQLLALIENGFFIPNIDACKGHSGSGVWSFDAQFISGIFTGSNYEPQCNNLAVPLLVQASVDEGCNGPDGGVSLGCLADHALSR